MGDTTMATTQQVADGSIDSPDDLARVDDEPEIPRNLNATVIAGTRVRGQPLFKMIQTAARDAGFSVDAVISGGAWGVDEAGEAYADRYNLPLAEFPAHWEDTEDLDEDKIRTRSDGTEYDPYAGFKRNWAMADYGDSLIAIWDGVSNGTAHMIRAGIKRMGVSNVLVHVFDNPETDEDPALEPGTYTDTQLQNGQVLGALKYDPDE